MRGNEYDSRGVHLIWCDAVGDCRFRLVTTIGLFIPAGVTSIGRRAFQRCSGLTDVSIARGLSISEVWETPRFLMGVIWVAAIYDKVRCTAASSGVSDLVMWGKVMFMMGACGYKIRSI